MWGHNTCKREGGQIWKQDRKVLRGLVESIGIRLATLNIMSGKAEGLEVALQSLKQGNIDVVILQET